MRLFSIWPLLLILSFSTSTSSWSATACWWWRWICRISLILGSRKLSFNDKYEIYFSIASSDFCNVWFGRVISGFGSRWSFLLGWLQAAAPFSTPSSPFSSPLSSLSRDSTTPWTISSRGVEVYDGTSGVSGRRQACDIIGFCNKGVTLSCENSGSLWCDSAPFSYVTWFLNISEGSSINTDCRSMLY